MSNATDPFRVSAEAEAAIKAKHATREATQPEFRSAIAIKSVSDELVRLNAEMKTLRFLFAGYAAKK